MDQGPPHETRYTETNRRESGEKPGARGDRASFPEQHTEGLCSTIKNWQKGPHKIAKVLQGKGHCQ